MTREQQRAAAREQMAAARTALRARVAGITPDEARHLAEEVREATHADPQARIRVLEALERLGIPIPAGFK
jgi:Spy/CpxP family protein refolding chaperone